MAGDKLTQLKKGMTLALDGMAKNNQVGMISFSTELGEKVAVSPLSVSQYTLDQSIQHMRVQGSTALYEAVKAAVEMTDVAPGDPNAIRGVVVLTDGRANAGNTGLDSLIDMISTGEARITQFRGFEGDVAIDEHGRQVERKDIIGTALKLKTTHPIQVFFIGIGEDTDLEIGRMLAQATGAEFQGVAEEDLASLLELFSKYF